MDKSNKDLFTDYPLHNKALELAKDFKRIEIELVEIIQKIDASKIFRKLDFASLYEYVSQGLGLSESVSYSLINVSRKSMAVPELKLAIVQGSLSISQAKRITSVITNVNASTLIAKARVMTQKEIEKEVAKINPKAGVPERARYISETRVELRLSLKEEIIKNLRRIQDLECQRTKTTCDLEKTLEVIINDYIQKHDPVKKSEKVLHKLSLRTVNSNANTKADSGTNDDANENQQTQIQNTKMTENSPRINIKHEGSHPKINQRVAISSEINHQVNQRDQGQCCYKNSQGARCLNRRWLDVHHRKPIANGGDNSLANLITLCKAHHQLQHESES